MSEISFSTDSSLPTCVPRGLAPSDWSYSWWSGAPVLEVDACPLFGDFEEICDVLLTVLLLDCVI